MDPQWLSWATSVVPWCWSASRATRVRGQRRAARALFARALPQVAKADLDHGVDCTMTNTRPAGGLRPLLAGESESTSKLSREHTVVHPVPSLQRGSAARQPFEDGPERRNA